MRILIGLAAAVGIVAGLWTLIAIFDSIIRIWGDERDGPTR